MPSTKATKSQRTPKLKLVNPKSQPENLVKLDIACGQRKQQGFIGIDRAECEGVDIVHDLTQYPWPVESGSVGQAFCSHYVEHIPMIEIPGCHGYPSQDAFFAFFDEVYRILAPSGQLTVIAPYYTSMRCWQDPTHRRAISEASFLYMNKEWREINLLGHYQVGCDFDFGYSYIVDQAWVSRNDEARGFAFRFYNNAINDIQVTLTKRG